MGELNSNVSHGSAENQLLDNDKMFRLLFESMSEGCAIHRVVYNERSNPVDYLIVDANPAFETILGLKKEVVAGKKASEVYGSEPPYLDIYSKVASSGMPISMDVFFPPMNKYFHVSVFSPQKGYFATVFSDITALKQTEEAIQQKRDELDQITSDIGVGLTIISKDYHILWANKVLRDAFGKVEGKSCYSAFHGTSGICQGCGVRRIFDFDINQAVYEQVSEDIHGKVVWSQIVATPFKDKKGNTVGALEAVVPITERKQAEERLRESESFNSSLLENAPNPIIVYNPDYSIRYVNPSFKNLTGFSSEDLAGTKQPYPWWPEDKITQYENENLRLRHEETSSIERLIVTKNGEPVWVAISEQHILNKGSIKYYISNWVGITERKKVEEALKEEVNTRARFIDVIAHELRGPLSPILSSSEILKDLLETDSDDKLRRLSLNAYTSTQILSKRLEELLDTARYSRGAFTLNSKPTDLNRFIQEVITRQQAFIERSEHKLIVNVPPDLPVIKFDASKMEQVLINLLSNACKYSPANTIIELTICLKERSVLIEIQDQGKGLSEYDSKHLFQPYYQLERDRQKSNGLGLGLSICKQIVEAHGGKIWVNSKPGIGSAFAFNIPL